MKQTKTHARGGKPASSAAKSRLKPQGWLTTDAFEIALRKERAAKEPFRVMAVKDGYKAPFCNYTVSGGDNMYQVEFRSSDDTGNTCTCPDFRKNGLGTCKHIERVRSRIPRLKGVSPHLEIVLDHNAAFPRMICPDGVDPAARDFALTFFTPEGTIRQPAEAALASLLREADALPPDLAPVIRISSTVRAFAAHRERQAALDDQRDAFAAEIHANQGRLAFLNHPLYDYQIDGMLHLAFKGRAILADDMGLGKTIQAIAAAATLRGTADVRRVLIVAPASLKTEWEEQIRTFTQLKHEVLLGSRPIRLERYRHTPAFFLIANYEQVLRDSDLISAHFKPDLIILDEAQRIKNWQTKTAQTLKRLESRFVFVLTGTPLENRIDDIYSLSELIDPTLFGSLFRFNRRFYRFDSSGKVCGMQNLDALHEELGRIMLRRRKDEIAETLPERTDKNYFVDMTDEQRKRYDDDEAIVARLCAIAGQRPLRPEEFERLQRHLARMRMLCDTCHILDPKITASPKVDELMRILDDIFEEAPGRKVLIFSEWVRMLNLVVGRLEDRGLDHVLHTGSVPQATRRQHINRFKQDPACRLFLSSDSGSVGLNLQAASVVINLDLPWNPAKLEQRIARAWRKRQRNAVHVINLVAAQSIEERMLATLSFKQGLSDFVLDARGDQQLFEKTNAKSAFLSRLTDILGRPVVQSQPCPEDSTRLLADAISLSNPGITQLSMKTGGVASDASFLAVGNELAGGFIRSKIKKAFGADLPADRLTVLTPDEFALLKKLEAQGFIQFVGEKTTQIYSTEPVSEQPVRRKAALLSLTTSPMTEARRELKLAKLLGGGGFPDEAAAPAARAVKAAATALHVLTLDTVPETAPDIATAPGAFDRLTGMLEGSDAVLLQLCLTGDPAGSPALVSSASAFVEHAETRLATEALKG